MPSNISMDQWEYARRVCAACGVYAVRQPQYNNNLPIITSIFEAWSQVQYSIIKIVSILLIIIRNCFYFTLCDHTRFGTLDLK